MVIIFNWVIFQWNETTLHHILKDHIFVGIWLNSQQEKNMLIIICQLLDFEFAIWLQYCYYSHSISYSKLLDKNNCYDH